MKADDEETAIFTLSSFMRAAASVTSGSPCCVRVETIDRIRMLEFGVNVGRPLTLSYQTAGPRILKPPFDARHANKGVWNGCHAPSWDVEGS